MCKHRFGVQLLQNPPLYSSNFKDTACSFRFCSLTYQHISIVGENGKAQIVFQKIRVEVLRDLRGSQNWEDFSVQLPEYRDQRELKRLKGKSSLKSLRLEILSDLRGRQKYGRLFGSSPRNTEIRENI